MGDFNRQLLEALALTADPDDDNTMNPEADRTHLGFDDAALKRIDTFKNALFKTLMMRAANCYSLTNQDSIPEEDRQACTTFSVRLGSWSVHPEQPRPSLLNTGVIPVAGGSVYDDPAISAIVELFDEEPDAGGFRLACK